MALVSDTSPERAVTVKPRVTVTRKLLAVTEGRMRELFDVVLNDEDRPLSREELVAAVKRSDVLVPTVTDRIDAELLSEAGDSLGLIASFGSGIEHIDLAAARGR
jgi:glyoxylate reductase